jgi:hypothetical protein
MTSVFIVHTWYTEYISAPLQGYALISRYCTLPFQATFFEPNRVHCRPRLSALHSLAWPVQPDLALLAYPLRNLQTHSIQSCWPLDAVCPGDALVFLKTRKGLSACLEGPNAISNRVISETFVLFLLLGLIYIFPTCSFRHPSLLQISS